MAKNAKTSDPPNEPKTGSGILSTIINKVQPRSIERLILLVIVLFAIILAITIYTGGTISFFGIKIEATSNKLTKPAVTKDSVPNISLSELSIVSDKYFNSQLSKDQVITTIKSLIKDSEELKSYSNQFFFKLLKLELLIPKYGYFIDTRIIDEDPDKKEVFKITQSVLRDLNSYLGPIDGNQQSTYNAVSKFQKDYNDLAGKEFFPPKEYGIFGYGTLEAIRSTYRSRNQTPI